MKTSNRNQPVLAAAAACLRRLSARGRLPVIIAAALLLAVGHAGQALAAASSVDGGIGAQVNTMSSELINAGGTGFGAAFYIAALISFLGGVWALWQSRQPQNRESGYVAKGLAGLVLCGLLASGGAWIEKAAISTSGGDASISTTPGMVSFSSPD